MSFKQAYYTSCEIGLRGSKGFQINAASPDIDPVLLQQIERLGLYIPPVSAPSRPSPEEIRLFPVSLLFQCLGNNCAILAQAKYLGTDYSGRFGNYFTHSLISYDSEIDIKKEGFLPIEMWQSSIWSITASTSTSLPVLTTLRTGGIINALQVSEFLEEKDRLQRLPLFLTAVEQALATKRRIILVDDCDAVALWIAAASYALPWHIAIQLTFNTYVKNPYQTEFLIVGTTKDSDFNFAPHEIEHQFFVFDFEGTRFTHIQDVSAFASKVATTYESGQAELVAAFSRFVERIAPDLRLEEVDTAYSCYSLIVRLHGLTIDEASVINFCARYLCRFEPQEIQLLLSTVMTSKAASNETLVDACANIYSAALDESIPSTLRVKIELPYLEWLVNKVCALTSTESLYHTVDRLRVAPDVIERLHPFSGAWLRQTRQTPEPARLSALLNLGDKLGFLEEVEGLLPLLGESVIGPALVDANVQRLLAGFAARPALLDIMRGVGAYLTTQITKPESFDMLIDLLSVPAIFDALEAYAIEQRATGLYFRIHGTIVAHRSDRSALRVAAFQKCLSQIDQFDIALTPGHVDDAFRAIWQNNLPTDDESSQLLSMLKPQQLTGGSILERFVALIATGDLIQHDPKRKALIKKLMAEPLYDILGKKSITLDVYNFSICLQQDGEETTYIILEALQFLEKHKVYLNEIHKSGLYDLLAKQLVQIKDAGFHRDALLKAYKYRGLDFISKYGRAVESSLSKRSSVQALVVARLFQIWMAAERTKGDEPAATLFNNVLPQALRKWRAGDLNAVANVMSDDKRSLARWKKWQVEFGKKGFLRTLKQKLTRG